MSEREKLPDGWQWVKLGDISQIIAGQSPPSETYRTSPEGLPFFQGKADFGSKYPVPRVWCVAPHKVAEPGDILISVRAPVGPTNVADVRCCIGRGLSAIRPNLGVADRDFILYALKISESTLAELGSGSTFAAIGQNHLRELDLPLPPLPEQRRIVAALEEKLAAVEQARQAARAQLEAARALPAAYLRAVFEGEEARGWERRPLGAFVESYRNGFGRRPEGIESGPVVLRIADVSNGYIDLSAPRRVQMSPDEFSMFRLNKGDALFIRVNGSSSIVGRCISAVERYDDVAFNDHLIRVRLSMGLDAEYLSFVCNLPEIRAYIEEQASTSAGQLTVNQQILANIQFCAPPISRQLAVVQLLKAKQIVCDKLITELQNRLEYIEAMPAAYLQKAFRGEL